MVSVEFDFYITAKIGVLIESFLGHMRGFNDTVYGVDVFPDERKNSNIKSLLKQPFCEVKAFIETHYMKYLTCQLSKKSKATDIKARFEIFDTLFQEGIDYTNIELLFNKFPTSTLQLLIELLPSDLKNDPKIAEYSCLKFK